MKKLSYALTSAGVAGALFIAGCGSTPEADSEPQVRADGTPTWFITGENPGEPGVLYGFGASAPEPSHPNPMRRQARMAAAGEIAENMEITFRALANEYFELTNTGDGDTQSQSELQQTAEMVLDVELVGVEVARTDYSDDGRWFVMSQYDLEQDFDVFFDAMGVEPGTQAEDELRSRAQDHLNEMNDRM